MRRGAWIESVKKIENKVRPIQIEKKVKFEIFSKKKFEKFGPPPIQVFPFHRSQFLLDHDTK